MQLTRLYSHHFQNNEKPRKIRLRLFSAGVLKLWEVERHLDLRIVLRHHGSSIIRFICKEVYRLAPALSVHPPIWHSQRQCAEPPETNRGFGMLFYFPIAGLVRLLVF